MNRSIKTLMTAAALAAGAFGAAGVANAQPDAYVTFGVNSYGQAQPRPYPGSAPVTVVPERSRHAYNERYAYNDDRRHRRDERCGAQRWDPNTRYMPGAVVWRNGEVYQARPISNRVYNENSPPEWTPNYWREVDCR